MATHLITGKYNTALKTVTAGRYVQDVMENLGKANYHYSYLVLGGRDLKGGDFFFFLPDSKLSETLPHHLNVIMTQVFRENQ